MSSFLSHLRLMWRQGKKNPLFSLVVVTTLSFGIGTASAIFALVYGILRPLPFGDSHELVTLWEGQPKEGLEELHVSPPNFADWSAQSRQLEGMSALYPDTFNLTGEGLAERVFGASVSPGFFRALGVSIRIGRDFAVDEAEPSAPRVVVLSHGLWQRRYGGSTEVLGQAIRLNGASHTVIGILPRDLELPRTAKLWIPLRLEEMNPRRDARALEVLARLRPGATLTQAQEEMDTIAARLAARYPESNEGWNVSVVPLLDELVGDTRPMLWLLIGAVGLLLLITCVNVASLLFARGLERTREIAVRQAFGASRKRILAQLLSENLLLALAAGGVGIVLAWAIQQLFEPLLPAGVAASRHLGLSLATLAFALLLGLATTVIFGLVPAFKASRREVGQALQQGGRGASEGNLTLRSGLVVSEFALTFALLLTTLLLGRSFVQLLEVDPGFRADQVLTARVGIDPARYGDPLKIHSFFDELVYRAAHIPGVASAAAVDALPLVGSTEGTVFLPSDWPMPKPGDQPITRLTVVSQDYFRTLEIPLLEGRDFQPADTSIDPECECVAPDTTPIVVINQTMAEKYWPGQNPVGQWMKLGDLQSDLLFEIVGVAKDARYDGLDAPILPRSYLFSGQFPVDTMSLALRTEGDPRGVAGALRRELRELDAELPAYGVATLEEMLEDTVAGQRLVVLLLGVFTALALTLSALGLYGVISTTVAQRTREFGIHIALGSRGGTLLWMVLRRALFLGALGVGGGALLAVASARALGSLLVGVTGADPLTFLMAAMVLVAVMLAGALMPALRVARLDPVVALRYE